MFSGLGRSGDTVASSILNLIEIVDVKYFNNIVEQSYRPKQKMVQASGWKLAAGAIATMSGQEVWTQIKRGQVGNLSVPIWGRFNTLATYLCLENGTPASNLSFATEPEKKAHQPVSHYQNLKV